jgi:phage shock protein A
MGIFTRFRDIVSSNISAMLDRAEDPEKLIKLMIREMEDTLVEIKVSCAGVMADRTKVERQLAEARAREKSWQEKAELAVNKDRDDLAREALIEKRRFGSKSDTLEKEHLECNSLVDQYKDDIRLLEDKLGGAREKQRMLVQRHIHATGKKRAQGEIRRMDSSEAIFKFDELENRIERMEAEADLVNYGRKPDLEGEFEKLAGDDEIERELDDLKSSLAKPDENISAV